MNKLKSKLIAAFFAAGLTSSAAFVARDVSLPAEGLVLAPYSDPVGKTTLCVGHLVIKEEVVKKSYTEEECMQIFAQDWKKHLAELDKLAKQKNIKFASEWQRQALNDFTFNVGIGNVQSSTLIKLLAQGEHRQACQQLTRWTKGKVKGVMVTLKGLVTRRDKTMPYCMSELPYEKQKEYEEFLKEWKRYEDQTNQ